MTSKNGRPVQPKMPQQCDQRLQPLAPVCFDVEPFIVQKARAIAQAAAAFRHVALDDLGRGIALAAERAGEIAAGVIKNVAAAPVNELQQAEHRKAEAEAELDRLVDVLGAG